MGFVSPLLWHTTCPFDHVRTADPAEAARLVEADKTVLVPGPEEAVQTLILLGVSAEEARHHVAMWSSVS